MKLRAGTRDSRLALIQAVSVVEHLRMLLPGIALDIVPLSSPGDRDRKADLRECPDDFFTRDLDEALLNGELDIAIHSAKDVPDPLPEGLDWFWLPWREDRRDVLVAAPDRHISDLTDTLRIGVSSDRRSEYCRARFPQACMAPIRGNIEDRLQQLDDGKFDVVVMAAAALLRLGLADRVSEWISLDALPTPEGQGALAITFRADDARILRLRSLFVKTVVFVGGGVGSANLCTVAGVEALRRCDVCLHDTLLDTALLDHVPDDALQIDVGKRCGAHRRDQQTINALLAQYALRGLRVVRLKGGDPGIFGRLAEEVEALESLNLPYRVVPGVSSLSAATTGTGLLLTRREVSRGFSVMSARVKGGKTCDVSASARAQLPCVFFMGMSVADEISAQLIAEGIPADTPAAIVYNAGADNETILRTSLGDLPEQSLQAAGDQPADSTPPPGLLIIGDVARYTFTREHGALQGKRVLLTCSSALQARAADAVRDLGGLPIPFPLIRMSMKADAREVLDRLSDFDWLVMTSPSAVRMLIDALRQSGSDLRTIPRIIVSGPATARELLGYGLNAALCPESDYGAKGLQAAVGSQLSKGDKILRLRSDQAGPNLTNALCDMGAEVTDEILYRNKPVLHDELPAFDMVFFASGSAVQAFADQWSVAGLQEKHLVAMGPPTAEVLKNIGVQKVSVPESATIENAMLTLASRLVAETIEDM